MAADFLRAYVKKPAMFAAHHVLINVVISAVPAGTKDALEAHGADFMHLICEGFSPDGELRDMGIMKVFMMFQWVDAIGLVDVQMFRCAGVKMNGISKNQTNC